MEQLSWKCLALIAIALFSVALAAPTSENESLDPLTSAIAEESNVADLDREKRKLPEATFGAKNAILGYVFGKIDGILDAKTKFLAGLDQANVVKNKELGIESPKPINSLQDLISAVISPKIAAITSKFGALSGGSIGGASSSGGATAAGDEDDGPVDPENAELESGNAAAGGSGGILSSVLKLSGPILSSSSSSAKQGRPVSLDDEEDEN